MPRIVIFTTVLCFIFSINACTGREIEMPEDFSLSFSWNTGSLPPQFRYDYVITIGPGPQGEFDYVPGYGDEGDPARWVTPFSVSAEDLQILYAYFNGNGFLENNWDKNVRERVGGSTTSLIIFAFGREYFVPSVGALEGTELTRVKNAHDFIRGFVPQAIWSEMEERQAAYEASQSD